MTPSSPPPSSSSANVARNPTKSASPAPAATDSSKPTSAAANSSPPPGQKPLPTGSASRDAGNTQTANNGTDAPRVQAGDQPDAMDVDSNGSDGDDAESPNGDNNGSDNQGSEDADGANGQRKKKSQKFYCTDYPPCNLSFTRSEHLARHIRKHTGERPFQCHCARRFSRLDNLRQHAQTVHLNEAIPADSPAAHGSRYQRQHRQERVRAAGNRARASTGGSAGGPVRGHSKSLSTSSINSMSSVGSAYSNATYGSQMDPRRRPPPLVMAADPRMHSEYRPVEGVYYGPPSPEFSTPTSATFSTAQTSPTRWGPGMSSPTMAHSRSHSLYSVDEHSHQRRLSVSSGQNPYSRSNYPSVAGNGSPNTVFSPSGSSYMASPSSAWPARRDSVSSNSDESWRRRTWHSDSRNADPRAPNPPPPIAEPPSTPQSNVRLPAIDAAFGPFLNREQAPASAIDPELTPRRMPPSIDPSPMERPRNANLYEPNLQRGLNRLELAHSPNPSQSSGGWALDPRDQRDRREDAERGYTPTVRFQEGPPQHQPPPGPARASRSLHQYTMSAPSASARDNRRHGWYAGPPQSQPGEPDQRAARVEKMEHPNMTAFRGFPQRDAEMQERGQERRDDRPDPLGRLEALVAVATSEGSTAAAY